MSAHPFLAERISPGGPLNSITVYTFLSLFCWQMRQILFESKRDNRNIRGILTSVFQTWLIILIRSRLFFLLNFSIQNKLRRLYVGSLGSSLTLPSPSITLLYSTLVPSNQQHGPPLYQTFFLDNRPTKKQTNIRTGGEVTLTRSDKCIPLKASLMSIPNGSPVMLLQEKEQEFQDLTIQHLNSTADSYALLAVKAMVLLPARVCHKCVCVCE